MSVKSKVKRCNQEIIRLENRVKELESVNDTLIHIKYSDVSDKELLENIVKYVITNQIGGIRGGMAIDWFGVDKMKDLKLSIEKNPYERSYIMRVNY